jgi:hypothetical protein
MFFNSSYLIYMLPGILLMMLVQWYVSSAYSKWSKVAIRSRLSGLEATKRLMQHAGLYGIQIGQVAGKLSDHYDPRTKIVRLSQNVHDGDSVASVAIAAHELGHAMQDKEDYFPLRFRSTLIPVVNIGSRIGWLMMLVGFFLNIAGLPVIGLGLFSLSAVFSLLTLPIEIDASNRAKVMLAQAGIVQTEQEQKGVNRVLNAAALTYVAALITSLLQLLYFSNMIFGRRR